IVPGLTASTGMPILNAIGSSLVAVTAFGLTTALNYSLPGLVDWLLSCVFIVGGILGGRLCVEAAARLSTGRRTLQSVFAGLIFIVALYMLWQSAGIF